MIQQTDCEGNNGFYFSKTDQTYDNSSNRPVRDQIFPGERRQRRAAIRTRRQK